MWRRPGRESDRPAVGPRVPAHPRSRLRFCRWRVAQCRLARLLARRRDRSAGATQAHRPRGHTTGTGLSNRSALWRSPPRASDVESRQAGESPSPAPGHEAQDLRPSHPPAAPEDSSTWFAKATAGPRSPPSTASRAPTSTPTIGAFGVSSNPAPAFDLVDRIPVQPGTVGRKRTEAAPTPLGARSWP